MYFPKGIVAQSDEAKQKAKLYNATVGLATKGGQPMHLKDIMNMYKEGIFQPSDIFSYAPGGGDKTLRAIWKREMIGKNPDLEGKLTSGCLVTAGLSHAISLVAMLFFGEDDTLVLPDLFWDNYELIFQEKQGGSIRTFPLYSGSSFNIEGMKEALLSTPGGKVHLLLNFPNNPTGYTPTRSEMKEIVKALCEVADQKKLLVICDDAYYGLFYDEETEPQSLFTYLADAHDDIFAIKGDAATKEDMVWGFRIGFVTYASRSLGKAQLEALEKKTLGAIRCTVSNCDRPGQSMLVKAIEEGENYEEDKNLILKEMEDRFFALRNTLAGYEEKFPLLAPYPFNSGYFMAFNTHGRDPEELRTYLLDKYQVGTINVMGKTLRLAYCSVETDKIPDLIRILYQAAGEIWN